MPINSETIKDRAYFKPYPGEVVRRCDVIDDNYNYEMPLRVFIYIGKKWVSFSYEIYFELKKHRRTYYLEVAKFILSSANFLPEDNAVYKLGLGYSERLITEVYEMRKIRMIFDKQENEDAIAKYIFRGRKVK